MLYNTGEKTPLVAEPSQRLIALDLSRERRDDDSGGAHALSNACNAVFYLQRRRQRR